MAHALLLQDEPDRALAELETVSPAHAAYAARMRGQAFARPGDEDAAAAEFANAIEAAPRDKDVWTDVARFRRANGHLARAIVAADNAVSFDAQDVAAPPLRGHPPPRPYGLPRRPPRL